MASKTSAGSRKSKTAPASARGRKTQRAPTSAASRQAASKPAAQQSPQEYLDAIADPARRRDMTDLHRLIRKLAPTLKPFAEYGGIGYGRYHYKYASGREGDSAMIGLSSRVAYISLYVCASDGKQYVAERYKQKLAKANIGKCCVRFKRLSDLDPKILEQLIREGASYYRTTTARV